MNTEPTSSPALDTVARFGVPPYIQDWHQLTRAALYHEPPLASLLTLINSGDQQHDWFKTFAGLTTGSLTESLIACHYHARNVWNLEEELLTTAYKLYQSAHPFSAVIDCGCDCKITFEYQAFVAAYRRSWDYLGQAVGAYFEYEIGSIKDFQSPAIQQRIQESPRGKAMPDVAHEILAYMTSLIESDVDNFAAKQQRPGPDRLIPWQNVFAGTLAVMNVPEEEMQEEALEIGLLRGNFELKILYQQYADDRFLNKRGMYNLRQHLLNSCHVLEYRVGQAYAHMRIIRGRTASGDFSAMP